MATKQRLADKILARAKNSRPGFRTWIDRLPADLQAEIHVIRDQMDRGEINLQKRAVATAIIEFVREQGHPICGHQGVLAWLNRKSGGQS